MKFISFDQFVKILESQQVNEATSGEQDFGIFMKYTKAMINYAKLKAKYPKLKQAENQLQLDELKEKMDIDKDQDDLVAQKEEAVKEKIRAEKEKLNKDTSINPEQKKIQRAKLNDMEKQAISKVKDSVSSIIDNEKSKIANVYKNASTKLSTEISDLVKNNPVSDVDSISAEWDEFKANVDLKFDNKLLDDKFALQTQQDLSVEQMKAAEEKLKKNKAKLQQDAQNRLTEIKKEKQDAEKALQDTINAANENPDAADAAQAIMDYNKAFQAFTALADSYTEDSSEEDLQKIKDAKKAVNAAKVKLSASKFVKAGFVKTKEEGEELVAAYKKDTDDAMDAYEDLKDKLGSAATEELKAQREQVKKINAEIKELEASKTKNVPDNETDEDKKTRIEGIDNQIAAKRKEIEELEKVEGESDSSYKQKPWYRTNTGSLNESIAQKFARLLKG
jgi:hypothetical protein